MRRFQFMSLGASLWELQPPSYAQIVVRLADYAWFRPLTDMGDDEASALAVGMTPFLAGAFANERGFGAARPIGAFARPASGFLPRQRVMEGKASRRT
jgi:hypothetical protein